MGPLKKIQYNCKQATFLIEKKALAGISFREEIELRIHLMGCGVCVLYKKQSKLINDMVLQLFKGNNNPANSYHLDEGYKKQMQDKIEQELNK
jgi:hypothetical protein